MMNPPRKDDPNSISIELTRVEEELLKDLKLQNAAQKMTCGIMSNESDDALIIQLLIKKRLQDEHDDRTS